MPAEGEDTLLSYDQVETLFHEFGHGLHGLLTQVRYPRFAGTSGSPRDYTEFPAQFMEHYASQPQVLEVYARHAETGEVIPQALVDKIRAASTHNQGFKTTEYIAASLLDLSWHNLSPNEASAVEDATKFEDETMTASASRVKSGRAIAAPILRIFSPADIQPGTMRISGQKFWMRTASRPSRKPVIFTILNWQRA